MKYTKKQIQNAINKWSSILNTMEKNNMNIISESYRHTVNENFWGGIVGAITGLGIGAQAGAIAGLGILSPITMPVGAIIGLCKGASVGSKLSDIITDKYFTNIRKLQDLSPLEISILTSVHGIGKGGIPTKALKQQLLDAKCDINKFDKAIERLERLEFIKVLSNIKLTVKGEELLKDAGFKDSEYIKDANKIKDELKNK